MPLEYIHHSPKFPLPPPPAKKIMYEIGREGRPRRYKLVCGPTSVEFLDSNASNMVAISLQISQPAADWTRDCGGVWGGEGGGGREEE